MRINQVDSRAIERSLKQLRSMQTRLDRLVRKAHELIEQATEVITNHGGRISDNEADIQTGKTTLIDHEQRIRNLEGS